MRLPQLLLFAETPKNNMASSTPCASSVLESTQLGNDLTSEKFRSAICYPAYFITIRARLAFVCQHEQHVSACSTVRQLFVMLLFKRESEFNFSKCVLFCQPSATDQHARTRLGLQLIDVRQIQKLGLFQHQHLADSDQPAACRHSRKSSPTRRYRDRTISLK